MKHISVSLGPGGSCSLSSGSIGTHCKVKRGSHQFSLQDSQRDVKVIPFFFIGVPQVSDHVLPKHWHLIQSLSGHLTHLIQEVSCLSSTEELLVQGQIQGVWFCLFHHPRGSTQDLYPFTWIFFLIVTWCVSTCEFHVFTNFPVHHSFSGFLFLLYR